MACTAILDGYGSSAGPSSRWWSRRVISTDAFYLEVMFAHCTTREALTRGKTAKSLVHQKTAGELDGAAEQITLRLLVSNAKLTEIDVAVH